MGERMSVGDSAELGVRLRVKMIARLGVRVRVRVTLSTDVKFVRFRKKYMMSITKSWGESQSMTRYDLVRRLDT